MKKTFLKISFLFFALVFVTSCGSDDDGPAEAAPVKFRASIAGQNVRTDNVNATLSNNGGRLSITAVTDFGPVTITLGSVIPDAPAITVQTYIIDDTGNAEIRISSLDVNYSSNAELGGAITISEINMTEMTVFGSFSATIVNSLDSTDTIAITNGTLFNVNFTVQ
jgi:hypothetical protein